MPDDTPAPAKDAKPADTAESVQADAVKKPETPEVPTGAENPDAVKRALDAERSAAKEAKKRADAAEAKVREYEDKDKSELEKLTAKATKAEQAKAGAEAKLLRYEVAAAKKVPAEAVDRLRGTTREELEADADKLLELVKSPNADKQTDFDGGAREPAPEPTTPEQAHNDFAMKLLGIPSK